MRISRQRYRPLNTTARLLGKPPRCPEYNPGLYTVSELDQMIFVDGYIPVANATEFDKIRTGNDETMGEGTCWEGTYTTGGDKKYVQVGNVDLSIFLSYNPLNFQGVYDGNELPITNLVGSQGLLGDGMFDFQIYNVILQGEVSSGASFRGLLAGRTGDNAIIHNCHVAGVVSGGGSVGGLVGNNRGIITNSSYTGGVNCSGGSNHGGFVGSNIGTISDSVCVGSVYSEGVNATYVGGFIGRSIGGEISRCRFQGDVDHNGPNISDRVCGGFIGSLDSNGIINDSYCIANVSGRRAVGGFVGNLSINSTNINRCYSASTVIADGTQVGPFVGLIQSGTHTVEDSYFDSDLAGTITTLRALPRTTIQMQEGTEDSYILPTGGVDGSSDPANLMYANWDPNVWDFGTSSEYPKLINTP